LRDHRGRELVGYQHTWRVEVLEQVSRPALLPSHVHPEPAGDVVQVALPFVQVRVLDVIKDRAQLVERPLNGPLGIDALNVNDLRCPADQERVIEDQELRIEDGRQLVTFQFRDLPADLLELFVRPGSRPFERGKLAGDAVRPDRKPDDLRPLNGDERWPDCGSARHPDANQPFHVSPAELEVSPKPDSTSSTSALTASRSSGPSALIAMADPRAAASSRIPMMLLPSITFELRETVMRD
jgi:hypothetical protein